MGGVHVPKKKKKKLTTIFFLEDKKSKLNLSTRLYIYKVLRNACEESEFQFGYLWEFGKMMQLLHTSESIITPAEVPKADKKKSLNS